MSPFKKHILPKTESAQNVVEFMQKHGMAVEFHFNKFHFVPKLSKEVRIGFDEPIIDDESELTFLPIHMTKSGELINLRYLREFEFRDPSKKNRKLKRIHGKRSQLIPEMKRRLILIKLQNFKKLKEKSMKTKENKIDQYFIDIKPLVKKMEEYLRNEVNEDNEENEDNENLGKKFIKTEDNKADPYVIDTNPLVKKYEESLKYEGKEKLVENKLDPYVIDTNPLVKKYEESLKIEDNVKLKKLNPKILKPKRENEEFYVGIPVIEQSDEDDFKSKFELKSESVSINSEIFIDDQLKKNRFSQMYGERKLKKGQYYVPSNFNEELLLEALRCYPDYWELNELNAIDEEICDLKCLNLIHIGDVKLNLKLMMIFEIEKRNWKVLDVEKINEFIEDDFNEPDPQDFPPKSPKDDAISLDEKDERVLFQTRFPLKLIMDNIPRMAALYRDDDLESQKWEDIFETNAIRDEQQEWDMDLITLPYDEEVQLMVAYYNRERTLFKRKRIQLGKRKKSPIPFVPNLNIRGSKPISNIDREFRRFVVVFRIKKEITNFDPQFPWYLRMFRPSFGINALPEIDADFYDIYECENRYVTSDSWAGKIEKLRAVRKKGGYLDKPTKDTNIIKNMVNDMYETFVKAKLTPEEIVLYLFHQLFPKGTPGPKNISKFLRNHIRTTSEVYKIFGTPPKTPEISSDYETYNKYSSSFVSEEEFAEELSANYDDIVARIALAEGRTINVRQTIEEEDVQEEQTRRDSVFKTIGIPSEEESIISQALKDQFNYKLEAENTMTFDGIITPDIMKTETTSTMTSIRCDLPTINGVVSHSEIVNLYIKDYLENNTPKRVVNPVWQMITMLKARAKWRNPPKNPKILPLRNICKMLIVMLRLTNMPNEFQFIYAYYRIKFVGRNERSRIFRKVFSLRYKKAAEWPVIDVQWHPFDNCILFVLLAKHTVKKRLGYFDKGKGYFTVFDLRYRNSPIFSNWLNTSPTCMAIHPRLCKYVIVGQIEGKVRFYNMDLISHVRYRHGMIGDTKLYSSVIELKWIDSKYKGDDLAFFSVVEHGIIHKWMIHRTYMKPIIHMKLPMDNAITSNIPVFRPVMITCVAFHPYNPRIFLLGTMFGDVRKYHIDIVNRPIFIYTSNYYVSLIKYNILEPKVFLICNFDQVIQVFEERSKECLYLFEAEEKIVHLEWAPFSSTVFIIAHRKALFVYDICLTRAAPEEMENVLDPESPTVITKFKFCSSRKYILAVSNSSGEVSFIKIAPHIRGILERTRVWVTPQTWTLEKERAKLQHILRHVLIYIGDLEELDNTTETTDNSELDTTFSTILPM